jgi:hypothetical protein
LFSLPRYYEEFEQLYRSLAGREREFNPHLLNGATNSLRS